MDTLSIILIAAAAVAIVLIVSLAIDLTKASRKNQELIRTLDLLAEAITHAQNSTPGENLTLHMNDAMTEYRKTRGVEAPKSYY